ncbi:helix-turn-helix transcriptional regulator [Saccharothrix longispora]|uniref:helix-turn-helix domain-containing protein n=1 Tax=Saccharothrix longispora TaxID=33920 RepID=UPI0028FD1AE0|nr:helix-turn-helix transcriptional regulator [Saccharothrix longispora]MDU0294230.1 helix-turn-helix transcriptional regulator [Saccharothrix longispora]
MPTPPPFRRRRLGKKLARMRIAAKLTLDDAAKALYRTRSTLHRIERGETILDVHLAKSMMDLYDQYDPDLLDQAVRAREPGWWTTFGIENQGYVDVETEAVEVCELSLLVIPGLLQTGDYMRALFAAHRLARTKRWLENDIRVRRIRQERLVDPRNPLRLDAIIDEAALRKVVGGPEVMCEQLRHLREVADLPNVSIRILADAGGAHAGMVSSFALLDFADPLEPPVLFIEHMVGAVHIEEGNQLREARLEFEHLASQALGLAESIALVERVLTE